MRILLLFMLLILCTGCATHSENYRRTGSPEPLRLAMLHEIEPGFSIEQVQSRLGLGEAVGKQQRGPLNRMVQKYPDDFPDGIEVDDLFFAYSYSENCSDVLQFRNNRLINFDPSFYENPDVYMIPNSLR
ncbi:MAG: hypothetical protein AAGB26_05460 [Planctomycetota bacterium]